MIRLFAATAVAAVVAGVGVQYFLSRGASDDAFAQCREGEVAGEIGGPFTLVNSEGQTVTDQDVITKPTLVYFGYTFCPDVCPLDAARNALAVDILEEEGHEVTPVFISVDPNRDTPEIVGDFAANLHERMIGLTGSEEQVKAASEAYRTYYKLHDTSDEFYLVDHSTFTYLVMPETGFVEFFRRDATAEDMAERTACFVDAAPSV
ncbi:MAG: SCO family protein [Pseudomonadota bacterium]